MRRTPSPRSICTASGSVAAGVFYKSFGLSLRPEISALLMSASSIIAGHMPVVVDFWAPWHAPRRTVAPEMEKVAAAARGGFVITKVIRSPTEDDLIGSPEPRAFLDVDLPPKGSSNNNQGEPSTLLVFLLEPNADVG